MLKFAHFQIIEVKQARTGGGLMRNAHRAAFDYTPNPGMIYVRSRAISSRCNDNFDEFPAEEIKQGYLSFIGKPVFVNHHNENHRRARGVIIAAVLHEDTNPDGTPDTWVEVLMEVDAIRFPILAKKIIDGEIDRTSMGCDVAYSKCSFCGNKAVSPIDYCAHIKRSKGQRIRRRHATTGQQEDVLVREICYGLRFFENSLLVEEPADPTAFFLGVDTRGLSMTASKQALLAPTGWEVLDDLNRQLIREGLSMQVAEVSTYIDKLAGIVNEATKAENTKPVFNLCEVSVSGTNLFCDGHKGQKRETMPQLTDNEGNDLTKEFRAHLESIGHRVTDRRVPAADLKATQSELIAKKVAGIVQSLKKGENTDGIRERIFVSFDDYIVDGHHRWAGLVAFDTIDGDLGDVNMDIAQVDMGIIALIEEANRFAKERGMKQRGMEGSLKPPCLPCQHQADRPTFEVVSHKGTLRITSRGKLDTSVSAFGMTYDPIAADSDWLTAAKLWDGWDDVRVTTIPLTGLVATEAMLSSESINKVVSGGEAFRAGYDPHIVIDHDGRHVIVDGNHRVAMHAARGDRTMAAKVVDLRSVTVAARTLNTYIGLGADWPQTSMHGSGVAVPFTGSLWQTRSTGMVHRSMNCRHINGEIVDPIAVQDVTEASIVAEYGHKACSTCFPSAPTARTALLPSDKRKTRTPQWDQEDEELHPRAEDGEFTKGPDQNAGTQPEQVEPRSPAQPPFPDSTPDPQAGLSQQQAQPAQSGAPAAPGQPQPPQGPAQQISFADHIPDPTTTGTGSKEDPVVTGNVNDAAVALAMGLHVELHQPQQVSTLLDKLSEQIAAAKAAGTKLDIDLCNVTVQGTNLFCAESKGIPRVQMPQLKVAGEKFAPDSRAVRELTPNAKGEYDLQPLFLQHLKDQGYTAEEVQEAAVNLKATQNQLNGGKIAGMTDALLSGKSLGDEPIFVSEDDYIVDGHHRWAANAAADYADGKGGDYRMSIWRIDLDIITLLKLSNDFATEYGAPQASVTASRRTSGCSDCGPSLDEMNAHARRKMAMADRSGIPEVDRLIEDFLKEPGIEELRDGALAHGRCAEITEQFVAFATERGFKAYSTDTDRQEMGYRTRGKPRGEVMDDEGNIVPGYYFEHTVASIYLPGYGWPYIVDFTASQYGYKDHPKVTSSLTSPRTAVSHEPPIRGSVGEAEIIKTLPPEHQDAFRKMLEMQERQRQWGSGGKWYHASKANLPAGTILVPGGGPATDAQFYEDQSAQDRQLGYGQRDQHVWVTPDREDASFWAAMLDAPFIYEVRPENPRPWGVTGADGHVCDAAKIVKQVSKTGRLLTAADIYDKRRLKGDVFGFEHNGRWLLGEATKAVGGTVKGILPFGTTEAKTSAAKTYFHGTWHDLPNGTILLPSSREDIEGNWKLSPASQHYAEFVWLTDSKAQALSWGKSSRDEYLLNHPGEEASETIHVYEVEPLTPVISWAENARGSWANGTYATFHARIEREVDTTIAPVAVTTQTPPPEGWVLTAAANSETNSDLRIHSEFVSPEMPAMFMGKA